MVHDPYGTIYLSDTFFLNYSVTESRIKVGRYQGTIYSQRETFFWHFSRVNLTVKKLALDTLQALCVKTSQKIQNMFKTMDTYFFSSLT